MENTEKYSELIDKYLTNTLSATEQADFEAEMTNNTALVNEVALQKTILNGLQAARKAELKARLDKVVITNTLVQRTSIRRIASGLVLLAAISTIVWTMWPASDTTAPKVAVQEKESRNLIIDTANPTTSTETVPVYTEKKTIARSEDTQETSTIEQVSVPKPDRVDTAPDLFPNKVSDIETPTGHVTETAPVFRTFSGVEVIKSKKHKFHYQYFDNKLYLYGDFDSKTYDILELNTNKGQKIYLKFESQYYSLESNKIDITPLELVKSPDTIQQLNALEQTK